MLLLPCLLALGIGLSLNNARAVLEAIFNHQSDFTRTPKYGIERNSQSWRTCKYRALKSTLPILELVPSYIHLNVNRLIRSAQRAHELVLYDLLVRLYESQVARAKQRP